MADEDIWGLCSLLDKIGFECEKTAAGFFVKKEVIASVIFNIFYFTDSIRV